MGNINKNSQLEALGLKKPMLQVLLILYNGWVSLYISECHKYSILTSLFLQNDVNFRSDTVYELRLPSKSSSCALESTL